MNLSAKNARTRLYLLGVAALTLTLLVLRTVALFTAFDAKIGYFEGGALKTILYIMEGISLLACFAFPFLVKAENVPSANAAVSSLTGRILTSLCALSFAVCAIALFLMRGSTAAPSFLIVISALLLFAAAFYFLPAVSQKPSPYLGYAVILAAILTLSVTYFDRYTQMNAPLKLSLHVSLLSVMLFMLYDIRVLLDMQRPRARIVCGAIAFLLCTSLGGSNLIAYAAGIYEDALYFFPSLLLVGFSVYVAWQLVREPLPEEIGNAPEKTEAEETVE